MRKVLRVLGLLRFAVFAGAAGWRENGLWNCEDSVYGIRFRL